MHRASGSLFRRKPGRFQRERSRIALAPRSRAPARTARASVTGSSRWPAAPPGPHPASADAAARVPGHVRAFSLPAPLLNCPHAHQFQNGLLYLVQVAKQGFGIAAKATSQAEVIQRQSGIAPRKPRAHLPPHVFHLCRVGTARARHNVDEPLLVPQTRILKSDHAGPPVAPLQCSTTSHPRAVEVKFEGTTQISVILCGCARVQPRLVDNFARRSISRVALRARPKT